MICPENNWEIYSYNTDNGLVVVRFYEDANKIDQTQYPLTARIIITMKQMQQNGGPTDGHAQELWNLEDEIVAILEQNKVNCMLLGFLTHSGVRELIFQVGDLKAFRPHVGKWMHSHTEFEIDASEHDGWDFFFQSVWPSEISWHLIHDRRVVENLLQNGSNQEKLHSLEYVFYGDKDRIDELKKILSDQGYEDANFDSEERRLIITKKMKLDLSQIYAETQNHIKVCSELEIDFDGWGASVVE